MNTGIPESIDSLVANTLGGLDTHVVSVDSPVVNTS
jgi:hypothetical protein